MITRRELPAIPDDTLTREEIKLVKYSWDISLAGKSSPPFSSIINSEIFWKNMTEIILTNHPDFERVLPSTKHQTVIFSGLFKSIMMNLEDLHSMDTFLATIGKKHLRVFGIDSSYFLTLGMAFIEAIEIFCYPCTDKFKIFEVCKVWGKIFAFLSNSMVTYGENDEFLTADMINDPIHAQKAFIIASSTTGGSNKAGIRRKMVTSPTLSPSPSSASLNAQSAILRDIAFSFNLKPSNSSSSSVRSGGSSIDARTLVELNSRVTRTSSHASHQNKLRHGHLNKADKTSMSPRSESHSLPTPPHTPPSTYSTHHNINHDGDLHNNHSNTSGFKKMVNFLRS